VREPVVASSCRVALTSGDFLRFSPQKTEHKPLDSDPRLHSEPSLRQGVRRKYEATVSGNVSRMADTVTAPGEHPGSTLTAP